MHLLRPGSRRRAPVISEISLSVEEKRSPGRSSAADRTYTMSNLTKRPFGSLPSGEPIVLYTFTNGKGIEASITNFGGRVVKLLVPDRNGELDDVALGFDDLDGYLEKN